jgi:4-hydroxy-tetrahydrodipicolinate synthase
MVVMDLSRLRGIYTPMLTPLTPDERVDVPSLRQLVDYLIGSGVHGLWALGTTGEFALLPTSERARAAAATVEQAAGRVPVIVSVGDSSTGLALRHVASAVAAGADAIASTPPHYFRHTMDEAVEHFRTLKAAAPDMPLLVYNIPQTVKVEMTVSAVVELAREGVCSGIKDSQNDLEWFRSLVLGLRAEELDERFPCFLGTRALIDAGVAIGAAGAIPSISNVVPAACVETFEAAAGGDFGAAAAAQEQVVAFEELIGVAAGGSRNAAIICGMKEVLRLWGVIEHATACRPLRPLTGGEVDELARRVLEQPLDTRANTAVSAADF